MIKQLLSTFIFILTVFSTYSQVKSDTTKMIYTFVDEDAEYPGGYQAMTKYIQTSVVYPNDAALRNITGTVYIQFIVGADGEISSVRVQRGVYKSLDEEAFRVISEMPEWKPGLIEGKPVAQYYSIPITFQLEGVKKKRRKQ